MKYIQKDFLIRSNAEIRPGFYDMAVHCPEITEKARAGQFVNLLCGEKSLRRPISICELNKEEGILRMVYQVRGEGTAWLSRLSDGDTVNILGPLGNGFNIPTKAKSMILVGGGIGTPPLLGAAKAFMASGENRSVTAILGFRNSAAVILEDDYRKISQKAIVTTDDGSYGRHSLVTAPLEEELEQGACDVIIACGPLPMLKAVSLVGTERNIQTFVSMEQRMGCGVGACLACVCKTKHAGEEMYSRVCTHGPIFNASKVVW